MKRILIIGPLPDHKNEIQYGGATVLMNNIINYWKDNNLNFTFIQTNKFSNVKKRSKAKFRSFLWFALCFMLEFWRHDIIWFNVSDHFLVTQYPFLLKFLKLFHKRVILHKFGGSITEMSNSLSRIKFDRLIASLLKTDLLMFETLKSISDLCNIIGKKNNIIWYPNGRKKSSFIKDKKIINHNLIYIGHITDSKGIQEIIEAKKNLPSIYKLDFYGAIKETKYENFPWASYGITYHGEVSSSEVPKILSQSHLLLLPSWKEGYPGIVIEALSVGVPVVVSNVGGLPEMIVDGEEGRIIPCKDAEALKKAILSITDAKYTIMSAKAYDRFLKNFDSDNNNKRIAEEIFAL